MLVRRAVVALGKRRTLARLAFARRRAAACDAAVKRAGLDLVLDELRGRVDALLHRPRHLGLAGDREMTPDVLEERPVRLREVQGIVRETLHGLLAVREHLAPVLESIPVANGRAAAVARARRAMKAGLHDVGVISSAQYSSLHPGYYVVFAGIFRTQAEASAGLSDAHAKGFPDAYQTRVTR